MPATTGTTSGSRFFSSRTDPVECIDCPRIRPASVAACVCGSTATEPWVGPRCVACGHTGPDVDTFATASGARVVLCDGCATRDETDVVQALGFFEAKRVDQLVRLLRERRRA